jgi:hypothetical protein
VGEGGELGDAGDASDASASDGEIDALGDGEPQHD